MKKFSDWLSLAVGVLSFITTVVLFIPKLQRWVKDPNMLHSFSVAAFLLFVLSILWFFIKSSVAARWRLTSLIILYIFSAVYFIWAGTWLFDTKAESSSEQLPTAQIMEPKNGEVIEMYTPFLLEYANIPTGSYLWVVVQVPKYDTVYLWDNDEFQSTHNKDGAISSTMLVGSTTSVGDVYNIIVLLVDEKVNFSFQEYRKQCKNIGQCNAIILPESGTRVLDFSTVTRK
jgi:Ca2+/Na+ antiporter